MPAAGAQSPRGIDRDQRREVVAVLEARVVGEADVHLPLIVRAVLRAHRDVPGVVERQWVGEADRVLRVVDADLDLAEFGRDAIYKMDLAMQIAADLLIRDASARCYSPGGARHPNLGCAAQSGA